MRRISVYRDGNQMTVQIGPDLVQGIAGFGDTVADALRDLANSFAEHHYELRGNSVCIEAAGRLIEVKGTPRQTPSDVLLALAGIVEERGYQEADFPEPNWERLAAEETVVPSEHQRN